MSETVPTCEVEGCNEPARIQMTVTGPGQREATRGYCWEHGPWKAAGEILEQHMGDPVLRELADQLVITRELAGKLRGAFDRALSLRADDLVPNEDLVPKILSALEGRVGRTEGLIQMVEHHEGRIQQRIEQRKRNTQATRDYLKGPVPNEPRD